MSTASLYQGLRLRDAITRSSSVGLADSQLPKGYAAVWATSQPLAADPWEHPATFCGWLYLPRETRAGAALNTHARSCGALLLGRPERPDLTPQARYREVRLLSPAASGPQWRFLTWLWCDIRQATALLGAQSYCGPHRPPMVWVQDGLDPLSTP